MKTLLRLVLFSVCWLASAAMAQWQWLDKSGRPVFSDRAPPPSVPEKSILKYPGKQAALSGDSSMDSAVKPTALPAQSAATIPDISGIDKTLDEKKKKALADEAAKRKADDDRNRADRADNCKRAHAAKTGIDSGVRLSQINAQGEREVMNDAARAAEAKRLQSIIDNDCQ